MSARVIDLDAVSNHEVEVLRLGSAAPALERVARSSAKRLDAVRTEEPGGCGGCGGNGKSSVTGNAWQSQWYDPPEPASSSWRAPEISNGDSARPRWPVVGLPRKELWSAARSDTKGTRGCHGGAPAELLRRIMTVHGRLDAHASDAAGSLIPANSPWLGDAPGGLPSLLRGGPKPSRTRTIDGDWRPPLPESRRDFGCGEYWLTNYWEMGLLANLLAAGERYYPCPPLVYSVEFAVRVGLADTSPAGVLAYITERDRWWVELTAMNFTLSSAARSPEMQEAARTLAAAALGARALLTFEARVRALAEWLFRNWTGELVVLDASYGGDEGGRVRYIGAWYDADVLDWFDWPTESPRLIPRYCTTGPDIDLLGSPWPDPYSDYTGFPEPLPPDVLEELQRLYGGSSPPREESNLARTDERQWPFELHIEAAPYPVYWRFDERDREVLDAIWAAAEAAFPAPLHDMLDPRDGTSWDAKWRALPRGRSGPPQGTVLLTSYLNFTHNPGWRAVAAETEASLPVEAVMRTRSKISGSPALAQFLALDGSAGVIYRDWEGRELTPIPVVGWHKNPRVAWWNCQSVERPGEACTPEEWCRARRGCWEVFYLRDDEGNAMAWAAEAAWEDTDRHFRERFAAGDPPTAREWEDVFLPVFFEALASPARPRAPGEFGDSLADLTPLQIRELLEHTLGFYRGGPEPYLGQYVDPLGYYRPNPTDPTLPDVYVRPTATYMDCDPECGFAAGT